MYKRQTLWFVFIFIDNIEISDQKKNFKIVTTELSQNPDFIRKHPKEGMEALEKESKLPLKGWENEVARAKEFGLEAAKSIVDRKISTFSRGELPHFAGINTFMKAPYVENVNDVGNYDVAIVGVPHDSGTTYRPGTRFGPQGIRKISALYTPYNYEMGVDLRAVSYTHLRAHET